MFIFSSVVIFANKNGRPHGKNTQIYALLAKEAKKNDDYLDFFQFIG